MNFKAFSLFELLVVLSIVAILSSMALPAYNDYIVKSRVLQLVSIADSYKLQLFEDIISGGVSKKVYKLDTDSIDDVAIDNTTTEPAKYIIQVRAKMKTKDRAGIGIAQPTTTPEPLSIQLQGQQIDNIINWTCHVANEYTKYVPSSCRNTDMVKISIG